MKMTNIQTPATEEEEIESSLPATAFEAMSLGVSRGSGRAANENTTSFRAAASGRGEPFPCFKKSLWGERLIVKLTQEHLVPRMA